MRVDIYKDKAGGWRWRLRARNGRIVAESGESYSSERKVLDACYRMANWAGYRPLGGTKAWNDLSEAFCNASLIGVR